MIGRITADVMRISGGKAVIMLEIDKAIDAIKCHEKYKNKELDIEIKQHREKRSLNANAYMWVLCREISEKLKIPIDEVYRDEIRQVGVFYDDEVEPSQVARRIKAWELIGNGRKNGNGWIAERVDFSADGNKELIRFYYGSSFYNKEQFSRLLTNVVQDAQNLGIDTRTPNEIAEMISLWESEK